MAKINLSPYTIKIREQRTNKLEDINALFGTKISLFNIINDIVCKYEQKPFTQSENQKALKFKNKDKLKTKSESAAEKSEKVSDAHEVGTTQTDERVNFIQDIIYYGEYGILMNIMDVKTGDMQVDNIDPDKSAVLDLTFTYFQDHLINTQSYLIAQTYSNRGYKTIFNNLLRNEIKSIFDKNVIVEIKPILSSQIIDLIKKDGRIIDITFISHDVSKDSADHLLSDSPNKGLTIGNTKTLSVSLTSSKNQSLINPSKIFDYTEWFKQMLLNSAESPFYEMTECNLNEIKLKIATKNKDFIIGISMDDLEFKEVLPLDNDDVILANGAIAHNYIFKEAKDYANSIAERYRDLS